MDSDCLRVRWAKVDATENRHEKVSRWNNVSSSYLVGQFVYVVPFSLYPSQLHTLDLKKRTWTISTLKEKPPNVIDGTSKALIGDSIYFFQRKRKPGLTSASTAPVELHVLDLVAKEWIPKSLNGESAYCYSRPHLVFWEARQMCLFHTINEGKGKQTYTLNVDTLEVSLLRTTGPAPSSRKCHLSVLLATRQEWVVSATYDSTDMLFVLNLNRSVPFWSQASCYALGCRVLCSTPLLYGSRLLYWGATWSDSAQSAKPQIGLCAYELRNREYEGLVIAETAGPHANQAGNVAIIVTNQEQILLVSAEAKGSQSRVFQGGFGQDG